MMIPKNSRNAPCTCGSGKKYKQCCLQQDEALTSKKHSESALIAKLLQAALEHHQAAQFPQAEILYQQILQMAPNHPDALHLLGMLAEQNGMPDLAIELISKALEAAPNFADAHCNLGSILQDTKRWIEAESCFRRALQIKPNFVAAHYNLGNTLRELGRLIEAESSYHKAIELEPNHAQAHANLGLTLHDLGRQDEAIVSLKHAAQFNPNLAEAHSNLGNALKEMGELNEAAACYERALQIKPNLAEIHNNLGNLLQDFGLLKEAESSYRRAMEINPDYLIAHSNLLFLLNYAPDSNPSQDFAEACEYGQKVANKVTARFMNWLCTKQPERLRIGFVSGDLGNHPVGYFLENLLTHINQDSFELIAYPTNPKTDELTARIRPYFSAWKPLYGLSDEAAAQLIHNDGAHILIDLSGHTRYNRLPVFAWKPAPVQVSWLGYFATTGVAEIDYLIADSWTLPESEEIYFTEKIWRLPETRLCFTPPAINVEVSPLPALTNGYITFGCFNNLTKMNDAVVEVWSRVLASVPDSRLFLKSKQLIEASVQQHTIERFAAYGIDANRLILEGQESREKYMAAYHRVDIALDPFPYPGGTTTVESLWMGVPVLNLAEKSFLFRQGKGFLMNAGLPDWIANDIEDYVRRATRHAADLQGLAELRSGLRQQVMASPIMDGRRFARNFEAALRNMWQRWVEPKI